MNVRFTLSSVTHWRIFLCKFCHLPHQVNSSVFVCADVQKLQHLLHNDHNILGVGDPKEQLQRLKEDEECIKSCQRAKSVRIKSKLGHSVPHLTLDDEVWVIETLYDGHLMLQGQFRILLNHISESFQAWNYMKYRGIRWKHIKS